MPDTERAVDTGFRFGGRLSLDLTWTVRYRAVQPTELLVEPDDLRRWLVAVALPAPTAPTTPTARQLADARALREAIHHLATCLIDGEPIADDDRELINHWAARPSPHPVLEQGLARRVTADEGREVSAALSAVARDAVELFSSHGDGRLRRCSGPRCSLLFHDDSRPGTRRWCDTARCGNKVNTKAYRSRRRDD